VPEADLPECGAEPTWWSARQLYQFNPSARAVEIAAMLMARYRLGEIKSGDVSQLIQLLGKIGFSPKERGSMNFAERQISVKASYFFLTDPNVGCHPAAVPFWLGAAAIILIFSFLGFFFSRLPLCSPLAMSSSLMLSDRLSRPGRHMLAIARMLRVSTRRRSAFRGRYNDQYAPKLIYLACKIQRICFQHLHRMTPMTFLF
jgi:hypothetical protein